MSDVFAPFQFNVPFDVFKSGDDGRMLFGGFVSSQKKDREDEVILQKGLDFAPWVERGWFNDNHDQKLVSGGGVVGVPIDGKPVAWLKKGDSNPLSGEPVDRHGWFVQGELLDTAGGRNIYEISSALQKANTKRRLGMSLEGKVMRRKGPSVLKAEVHNIAITQRPVSHDTVVEVLNKALEANEAIEDTRAQDPTVTLLETLVERLDALEKALVAGSDVNNPGPVIRVDGGYFVIKKALAAGESVDPPADFEAGDGFAFRQEDLDPTVRRVVAPSVDSDRNITFKSAVKRLKAEMGLNNRDAARVAERVFKQLQHQGDRRNG